jgi:hypothetical protein
MASITSWIRLEPRARSATVQQGLQARVHDPLWLLSRQWQLGEFQAQDGGAPVSVRLRGEAARLSRYHAGPLQEAAANGKSYDGRTPLEAVVEREALTGPAAAAPNPGRAAEAGQHFLRLLAAAGMARYGADYQAQFPFRPDRTVPVDADGARWLRVMSGRAPHGDGLYEAMDASLRPTGGATPRLPEQPTVAPADEAAVRQAALAWLAWYDVRYSQPGATASAWVPERMEYAFSVAARAAAGEAVLSAPEYHGGRLDWYDFDERQGATLNAAGDPAPAPVVRTVIPAPVAFRGMPDSRWWSFEDAESSLGTLEVGTEDLGRMLLLQFAFSYSDDWFTIPVDLDVGSLLHIRSLVVTDTFGVRTRIRPFHEVDGAGGAWRMFTQSGTALDGTSVAPAGDRFFLPPVLGASLEGRPVEEVHFLRDEMANMAWAVEHEVENVRGRAYDRHELYLATRPDPAELLRAIPEDAERAYRLLTEVPAHWIPLVPILDPATQAMRLRRGAVLRHGAGGTTAPQPAGAVLEPGRDLRLFEEEVPRAGAHVTRVFQHARWLDGSTHLWMSRRKRPGRGEGWSGLRFDVLEAAGAPQP